mgnify:CR=1 FL=1
MKRIFAFFQALVFCIIVSAPFSVFALPIQPEELRGPAVEAAAEADESCELQDLSDVLGLSKDSYVTRAQAVYILVSSLGDELKAVMPSDITVFSDYEEIDPKLRGAMGLAVSLGAVCGSDDARLHPNEYITRVEVFAIISRVLSQSDLPDFEEYDGEFFTDVPNWAAADILRLKNAGLVYGYGDGLLGSYDYMTYEQLRTVYERLFAYQTALPTGSLYKNDFYSYVNDQWLRETRLPEGYAKWSNIEQISQSNSYRIQKIISEIITQYYIGNEPLYGSNSQKILDVYRAAANVKYRDEIGTEPIQPLLDDISGINNTGDFMSVMAELEKLGIHSLLPITVNNDFKDSTKYSLSFESCYTGVTAGVIKSGDRKIIDLYSKYICSLFIESGQSASAAKQNADAVTELCVKLGEASMDSEDWDNPIDIYNVYDKQKLKELFGSVNILEYIRSLGYNKTDSVVVYDTKLARVINRVLGGTSINTLKNYLRAAVLDYSALYLNSETFAIYQNYIDSMSGMTSNLTPDAYAVTITQSLLPLEIGEEYVARYFSAESKKEIESLAELIIETFEKRIRSLDWLSEDTREVAAEKLAAISVRIGYPEYIVNYQNRDFNVRSIEDGGSLMEYLFDYNRLKNEQDNRLINENIPVNKEGWTLSPQSVNAYYDRANNCIVIPAGILQAPYYSPNASFESNLGGIGSVIAHEITHAFDNVGSQFDKNGNLSDWWKAEDFTAFNEICKKFVSEYDKIEFMDGCFVDGKMTLSENIADIGAMACILDIAGENNPNLDELFKTYARTYRCVVTDEYSKMLLVTDEHSPNKVRVNTVLSNFEQFLNLYHIEEGSGMYRAPEDRLSIW